MQVQDAALQPLDSISNISESHMLPPSGEGLKQGSAKSKGGGAGGGAGGGLAAERAMRRAEVEEQIKENRGMRFRQIMDHLARMGVNRPAIAQLHRQLDEALGDGTGRKLAVLHTAVRRLVTKMSMPSMREYEMPDAPERFSRDDEDRMAIEYEDTGPERWALADGHQPGHRRPFRGDQQDVMWEGGFQKAETVIGGLLEGKRGRPMLSAAVGMPNHDYAGDLQLDQGDKMGQGQAMGGASKSGGGGGGDQADHGDDVVVKKLVSLPGSGMCLSWVLERQKASELHEQIVAPGRAFPEQHGKGPMPGVEFFRVLACAPTDMKKGTSENGRPLVPSLRINVPETVIWVETAGGRWCGVYTEPRDGLVYRVVLHRDDTLGFLTSKRRERISRTGTTRRRPYTMRKGEPMFVSRSTMVKGQHGDDVNTLPDEKALKNSLAAGGGSSLSIWQGYVRSAGKHASLCRVVTGEDPLNGPNWKLMWTTPMGTPQTPQMGYLCNTTGKLESERNLGFLVAIERVSKAAWADAELRAAELARFAAVTHPFRRNVQGKMVKKFPQFQPKFAAVDFIVDRDGTWWLSQVYALRAGRVPDSEAEAKKGTRFMMEKPGGGGGGGGGKEGGDGSVADWICDVMHDLWCDRNEGFKSVLASDKESVNVQNQGRSLSASLSRGAASMRPLSAASAYSRPQSAMGGTATTVGLLSGRDEGFTRLRHMVSRPSSALGKSERAMLMGSTASRRGKSATPPPPSLPLNCASIDDDHGEGVISEDGGDASSINSDAASTRGRMRADDTPSWMTERRIGGGSRPMSATTSDINRLCKMAMRPRSSLAGTRQLRDAAQDRVLVRTGVGEVPNAAKRKTEKRLLLLSLSRPGVPNPADSSVMQRLLGTNMEMQGGQGEEEGRGGEGGGGGLRQSSLMSEVSHARITRELEGGDPLLGGGGGDPANGRFGSHRKRATGGGHGGGGLSVGAGVSGTLSDKSMRQKVMRAQAMLGMPI